VSPTGARPRMCGAFSARVARRVGAGGRPLWGRAAGVPLAPTRSEGGGFESPWARGGAPSVLTAQR